MEIFGTRVGLARTGLPAVLALCAVAVAPPLAAAGGPPPAPDRVFREAGLKYVMKRAISGTTSNVAGTEVPCGSRRWRAVGGGVDVVDGFAPAVYLPESFPFDWHQAHGGDADEKPDDGWHVFLREEAGPDLKVEAWAICAKRGGVRYRTKTRGLGMGEGGTAKASCGSGQLLGGGFLIAPVLVTEMSISMPFDGVDRGGRRDDGWEVHGFNHTGIGAKVWSHAICGRQGDRRYPSKAAPAPSILTTRSPQVRCGHKSHVTAGGGSVGSGHLVESHPVDGGDRGKAPDDGWRTTVLTAAGFEARTFAVCRR